MLHVQYITYRIMYVFAYKQTRIYYIYSIVWILWCLLECKTLSHWLLAAGPGYKAVANKVIHDFRMCCIPPASLPHLLPRLGFSCYILAIFHKQLSWFVVKQHVETSRWFCHFFLLNDRQPPSLQLNGALIFSKCSHIFYLIRSLC